MAYVSLPDGANFNDEFDTYIIAFCPDTDTFFITNQIYFYWESDKEFNTYNEAYNYFISHLTYFRDIRNKCGDPFWRDTVWLEDENGEVIEM